jgi:hypothetical protein
VTRQQKSALHRKTNIKNKKLTFMANECSASLKIGPALLLVVAAVAAGAQNAAEIRFRWLQGGQVGVHGQVPDGVDRVKVLEYAVEIAGIPKIGKTDRQVHIHNLPRTL